MYCRLSDGSRSPYAPSLLGNLRHWLEDDQEIRLLRTRSGGLNREELFGGLSRKDLCCTRK